MPVFTKEHAEQMHDLRQWARKQGRSVSGLSDKQRQDLAQAGASTTTSLDPSKQTAEPAPESSHDESDPQQ